MSYVAYKHLQTDNKSSKSNYLKIWHIAVYTDAVRRVLFMKPIDLLDWLIQFTLMKSNENVATGIKKPHGHKLHCSFRTKYVWQRCYKQCDVETMWHLVDDNCQTWKEMQQQRKHMILPTPDKITTTIGFLSLLQIFLWFTIRLQEASLFSHLIPSLSSYLELSAFISLYHLSCPPRNSN